MARQLFLRKSNKLVAGFAGGNKRIGKGTLATNSQLVDRAVTMIETLLKLGLRNCPDMKFAVALLIALIALTGCKTDSTTGSGGDNFSVFAGEGEAGCAKKGGLWVEDSGFFRCIRQTGEGTKSCKSGRDCKGECLAASKTCSPFDPLVGCTEVISDGGLLQKLCN